MEEGAVAGVQTPKLSGDTAEDKQLRLGSEDMEKDVDKTATLTETPTDTVVTTAKAEEVTRDGLSGSLKDTPTSPHSQSDLAQSQRFPQLNRTMKKQFTLQDLVFDLGMLLSIFQMDESDTRIYLEETEDIEHNVKEIETMAKQHAEKYLTFPANKLGDGGSDSPCAQHSTLSLTFSQDPRTVLEDRNEVTKKTFWALDELVFIFEQTKTTIDNSIGRLKIAIEYNRFVKTMGHRFVRPASYFRNMLGVKAVIDNILNSKKNQTVMCFQVLEAITRIADKLLAIAALMWPQVLQGRDADTKLPARQLDENKTEIETTTLDKVIGATETTSGRAADPIHGVHTQINGSVERATVSRRGDAIGTTAEDAEDANEARDPAHDGNASMDNGTDESETVTQDNEGDDKGTVLGHMGVNDKETVPGGKTGNDNDDETDKNKIFIKDIKSHDNGKFSEDN